MKVVLATNIISQHQMPIARRLADQLGEDSFLYVAKDRNNPERRALGWTDSDVPPWVDFGDTVVKKGKLRTDWILHADVVLCGTRDLCMLKKRQAHGKLTLYMSERWFKPPVGCWRLMSPRYSSMAWQLHHLSQSTFLHYLPIGRWAASDMRKLRCFPGRMWRWGYFVEPSSPISEPLSRHVGPLRVLWGGRMLPLKRLDTLVEAVRRGVQRGAKIQLVLIGRGPEEARLRDRVRRSGMEDVVEFGPPVHISDFRRLIRDAHVYVLPSNGYEGWGVVVNEAMLEGCAVVASSVSGSATTLIRDGTNGLLFRAGDVDDLEKALLLLEGNEVLRNRIARTGQETILAEWTPQVAAQRLLEMSEALLAGQRFDGYPGGPLARM